MAIEGKKLYGIYLSVDEAEYLKAFLDSRKEKGGLSAFLDSYVVRVVRGLQEAGIKSGQKLTATQLMKLARNVIFNKDLL